MDHAISSVTTADAQILRDSLHSPVVFAELFNRHAPAVEAYLCRRIGPEGARRVLAETFVHAFRHRGHAVIVREGILPWLLGTATRRIRRCRRVESRHWRAIIAAADEGRRLDGTSLAPGTALEVRTVAARIAALPVADRDALLLYAWTNLEPAEISAALEVPVGSVWARLNRVRGMFARSILDTMASDPEGADGVRSRA